MACREEHRTVTDHGAHAQAHEHDDAHEHGHGRARGHTHSHSHAHARAGARHRRPLTLALALIVSFLVVQTVTAVLTGSLALLSDAGHMATDALGLAMALAAIHAASRGTTNRQQTFGLYRLEILAALANAVLLVAVGIYVLVEAALRFGDPPHVASVPVLVVGVVGLAVNVAAFLLLRRGAAESLNLEAAYLEVLSDTLGSIGVIVGALVMLTTGVHWVDPLVGAAIGVFIVPRALRLGRDALRVLVQAAPPHIDVGALQDALASIPGVVDVHDLHVWTLTSEMEVASAHLMVSAGTDTHRVLDEARLLLTDRYGLPHATLQVEPDNHLGCEEVNW
jgi:cobalt-zinc-cadmium efflux system protein